MNLFQLMNKVYYNFSLGELRNMNADLLYQNLSYNSLLYINLIAYIENCTVSILAEKLQVSKPAVTSKINELIKQGYIEKTQSSSDKRVYYLSLKKEIIEEFELYDAGFKKAVKETEKHFSAEEIETACRVIGCLAELVSEVDHG